MPYCSSSTNTQQRRSPIASYRTHIPCGNYSCRYSCDDNCLQCIACAKFFHYKCKKLKRKDYCNFLDNNLDFICSDECYRSYLPFSEFINPIEFLESIFEHDGLYPCKRCKLECLDGNLMDCIQCEICESWYHAESEQQKVTCMTCMHVGYSTQKVGYSHPETFFFSHLSSYHLMMLRIQHDCCFSL